MRHSISVFTKEVPNVGDVFVVEEAEKGVDYYDGRECVIVTLVRIPRGSQSLQETKTTELSRNP